MLCEREVIVSAKNIDLGQPAQSTQIDLRKKPSAMGQFLFVQRQNLLRDKVGLNPFQKKPWFLHVCSTSLLKTLWETEKLLITSNFSFSYSVFYPFGEFSAFFIKFKIAVCKLFQFGRV